MNFVLALMSPDGELLPRADLAAAAGHAEALREPPGTVGFVGSLAELVLECVAHDGEVVGRLVWVPFDTDDTGRGLLNLVVEEPSPLRVIQAATAIAPVVDTLGLELEDGQPAQADVILQEWNVTTDDSLDDEAPANDVDWSTARPRRSRMVRLESRVVSDGHVVGLHARSADEYAVLVVRRGAVQLELCGEEVDLPARVDLTGPLVCLGSRAVLVGVAGGGSLLVAPDGSLHAIEPVDWNVPVVSTGTHVTYGATVGGVRRIHARALDGEPYWALELSPQRAWLAAGCPGPGSTALYVTGNRQLLVLDLPAQSATVAPIEDDVSIDAVAWIDGLVVHCTDGTFVRPSDQSSIEHGWFEAPLAITGTEGGQFIAIGTRGFTVVTLAAGAPGAEPA